MLLSYMIRVAAATHDSEKALRMFAELENTGYVESSKVYNSIINALASTKRFSNEAIEYWNKMQLSGVVPDPHTFVAVFKACSKLGDVETAYDAL